MAGFGVNAIVHNHKTAVGLGCAAVVAVVARGALASAGALFALLAAAFAAACGSSLALAEGFAAGKRL